MNELQPNNPEMGVKDFVAVLRRRAWLILPILLLCVGGAYAITMGTAWTKGIPKTWRAEAQVEVLHRAPVASSNTLQGAQPQADESMETQMGLIQSGAMADKTLYELKNEALAKTHNSDVPFTKQQIEESVKVTNPTDSSLLNISADANDPEEAKQMAEAVVRAFASWKQEDAKLNIKHSLENLKARYKTAQEQLAQAERAEEKFKEANHLADVDAFEKNAIVVAASSDTTIIALREDVASLESRVQDLDRQLKDADAAVSSSNGVPDEALVQSLQKDLNQLRIDRADTASKYTADFPGAPGIPSLANLDAQIKAKQRDYDRALKAVTNNASPSLGAHSALVSQQRDAHVQLNLTRARLAQALQAAQTAQQKVEEMPSLQRQYAQLHRTSELTAQIATSLQGALNETRLEIDQVSGNVLITVHGMVPTLPYKPNLKTNMMLGFALGALLSLGLVMLLEQTDQRVRTLDEVRALVSGPIIGMLPQTSRSQMNELAQGRLLPQFEEALSLVRVNLSYIMRHAMMREQVQHQTILVTSAVPGEGKSVAAAELARSMAESGKSVILVNANLRRPSQNILFQTGETGGLTDVLSGQLPLDEAIATTNVENLSILNSGVSNHNPTALLSQPRLATMMEELRFKADVVIIDAPDCTSVADTLLLTAHADCLLHVVRAGFIDMDTLHNASVALHSTGKKVTVLTNGLNRPQQRAFRSRFAYAALSSQNETPALPQTFEKTMVMNRSRDLVFSKSANKSLEDAEGTPDENETS